MYGSIIAGLAVTCGVMLLLPWGFKVLMRRFFHRNMSYFVSFWIVLIASMILCGVLSYFDSLAK
jgi:hypothetical protein